MKLFLKYICVFTFVTSLKTPEHTSTDQFYEMKDNKSHEYSISETDINHDPESRLRIYINETLDLIIEQITLTIKDGDQNYVHRSTSIDLKTIIFLVAAGIVCLAVSYTIFKFCWYQMKTNYAVEDSEEPSDTNSKEDEKEDKSE